MRKEKRLIANILKAYYEDMFFKTLLLKNIEYAQKNNIGKREICELQEQIKKIEGKKFNAKISMALENLPDKTDREFLQCKYSKKQNIPELMDAFGCGETNVWRKENKIFSFLYKYLTKYCSIDLEEYCNENEKV